MIDRTGQVWEDRDGSLIYLVLRTEESRASTRLVFYHRVLLLLSNMTGFKTGDLAYEYEKKGKPWEETDRKRLV